MAQTNIVSTLNGNYKKVYGKIVNAVPEVDWFLQNVKWDKGKKVGGSYEELIVLASENGYTYGGSGGTLYTLNASVAMATAPASVTPFEYTMRTQVSYGAASRAAEAGPRAFAKWNTLILGNMMESIARRLEISLIHGQNVQGLAEIPIDGFANSGATCTITIPEDQWAAGIWQGAEGAQLQVYDSSDVILADSTNTTIQITKVNFRTRVIVGTAASSTLASTIETANDSAVVNLFFKGSRTDDMVGLKQIFQNTTGSIHNISADTYGAWAGNLFDASSEALTYDKVVGYCAQLQARSRKNQERKLVVSPFTFADLQQEQMASRVYDDSYKSGKAETGVKGITYHTPSGMVEVVPHPCMKGGEAFLFPMNRLKRIGSSEKEWEIPGANSDPWYPIPDSNGAEIRNYSDQTVFCELPAECAFIDAIANNHGTQG